MKSTTTKPTRIWIGFLQPGDTFDWKGEQVTVTRTDREPIRNARLIYTDTGLELYIRRDDETFVNVTRSGKATS